MPSHSAGLSGDAAGWVAEFIDDLFQQPFPLFGHALLRRQTGRTLAQMYEELTALWFAYRQNLEINKAE